MELLKKYKIEIGIFVLALFARTVLFFVCLHVNGGNVEDTVHGQDGYFDLSRNLLNGNGFSVHKDPPFLPYSYGVPGYPFFLSAILWLTGSYYVAGFIQILIGSLIPVLGMFISRAIMPSFGRLAVTVGVLLALSPYQVLFSFIFYTEALFTALLGAFLLLYFRFLKSPSMRIAVWMGLLLGLATIVKPTVQYVFLIVAVFSLWHFRGQAVKNLKLKLVCFFLMFISVLSPWIYRNYVVFGAVNLSSQVSFNMYGTLLPSVLSMDNRTSFDLEQKKLLALLPPEEYNSFGLSEKFSRMVTDEIISRPVAMIKLSFLSGFTFFTHDGMLTFLQAVGVTPESYLGKPAYLILLESPLEFARILWTYLHTSMSLVFFARLFWVAVMVFFFVGLYFIWRRRLISPELLFSVIIVFYFMATTMVNGLSVNARFRMPVEPIIFAVSSAGLYFAWNRFGRREIQ